MAETGQNRLLGLRPRHGRTPGEGGRALGDLADFQTLAAGNLAGIDIRDNAHVHHPHRGAHMAGDGVDAGTAGQKGPHHGAGDLLGKSADPLGGHAVVPGHDQHGLILDTRLQAPADAAEPFGHVMQAPQGPGRHHQLGGVLPGSGDPG
jgi:hypothetical protein